MPYVQQIVCENGRQALAVIVPYSARRPHFSGPAYIRRGSESLPALPEDLDLLSTLLFRIAQIDVLRTYIQVPQANAAVVKIGDPAWITFAEYPGHSFAGAITRTGDSLDTATAPC